MLLLPNISLHFDFIAILFSFSFCFWSPALLSPSGSCSTIGRLLLLGSSRFVPLAHCALRVGEIIPTRCWRSAQSVALGEQLRKRSAAFALAIWAVFDILFEQHFVACARISAEQNTKLIIENSLWCSQGWVCVRLRVFGICALFLCFSFIVCMRLDPLLYCCSPLATSLEHFSLSPAEPTNSAW